MSYPILYSGTETAFADNGLGILSDAIVCTVTEERNGKFELQMQYPVSGIHFEDLALRRLLLAKPNQVDEAQPFRVYRITRPLDGLVIVYAQHISYDLSGIPVEPFKAANAAEALGKLKSSAARECPFTFWTDKSTAAAMTVEKPSSIRSLLGGSAGSILDLYGGEYQWDRFTVRLHGQRGADRGVSIRYGKNLTDIRQEEKCDAVYTGVYPYWLGQDGTLVQLPEKTLDAPGSYDFTKILPLDFSAEWQEQPTAEQLRARAQSYIKANDIGTPKVSLDVSFVQLEQTEEYKGQALLERVELCDTVSVIFPAMGVSATAKVITTVYDVLLERTTKVSIGDARATLADTIVQQQKAIEQAPTRTAMQQAIDHQTQLITGNKGGHAIMHDSDGDTFPDELLFTDKLKLSEAVKLLRINGSGIGFSQSGYNGPYVTAWTLDGVFNASFITAGTLDASKAEVTNLNAGNITTGTLSADRIAAGSISAEKIKVDDLSALKATIGGFTIAERSIYSGLASLDGTSDGVYLGTDGFSLGGGRFKVTKAGDLTAKSGTIAGWTIGDHAFYNGLSAFGGTTNGVYLGTDGISLGGKFKVDNSGNLTASSGTFTGAVYANMIQAGGDAGYITGGQIGTSTVTGGNIATTTITGGTTGNIAGSSVRGWNLYDSYASQASLDTVSANVASISRMLSGSAQIGGLHTSSLRVDSLPVLGGYDTHWSTITSSSGVSYTALCR